MRTGTWWVAAKLGAAVLLAACSASSPPAPGRTAAGADIWEAVRATCGTRPEQPAPRIHGFSWYELPAALGFHKPRTDEVWIRHPWVGHGTGEVTQACVLAHEMAHYAGVTEEADATACARAALARLSEVPVAVVRCGGGTAGRAHEQPSRPYVPPQLGEGQRMPTREEARQRKKADIRPIAL